MGLEWIDFSIDYNGLSMRQSLRWCIDCNKKLSKEKYTRCKKCSGINKKENLIERLCKQCGKLF